MSDLQSLQEATRLDKMSRCKCSKSDIGTDKHRSPHLENITTKMENRRCELIGRQKYLRNKITTMERSIPAMMAYNMWMAGQKCEDAPYCKIRQIMKKFSPDTDPTEKLLDSLKNTVKELNGETADLHEKIIDADVALEETGMELESLELVNKEMNDTVVHLENEVRSYTTPSLESIHSEDLACLSKIRQLAKEELDLKNYIKELEKKETIFRDHMDRLLSSRECQTICVNRRMSRCIQNLECNDRRIRNNATPSRKQIVYSSNKKRDQKELDRNKIGSTSSTSNSKQHRASGEDQKTTHKKSQEAIEKKSSWMANWWNGTQKSKEYADETPSANSFASQDEKNDSSGVKKEPSAKKTDSRKGPPAKKEYTTSSCKPCGHSPCPPPASSKSSRPPHSHYTAMNIPHRNKNLFNAPIKSKHRHSRPPVCELPLCVATDHGIRKIRKMPKKMPYSFHTPCEICPSMCIPLGPLNNCRCNCKGKCAGGLSDAPCNCGDESLDPSDGGYQPTGLKQINDPNDSNSDDDFCECCSCGCEDSDISICQCN